MIEEIVNQIHSTIKATKEELSHYEWIEKRELLKPEKIKEKQRFLKKEYEILKKINSGLESIFDKMEEVAFEEVPEARRVRTLPKKSIYSLQEIGVFLGQDADEVGEYIAQRGYITRSEKEEGKIKFETFETFLHENYLRQGELANLLKLSTPTIVRKADELALPKLILVHPRKGVFYPLKSIMQIEENTEGKRSLKAKLTILKKEGDYSRLYPKLKGSRDRSIRKIRDLLIKKEEYEKSILDR